MKSLVDKYEETLSQAKVATGYVGVDDNRVMVFLKGLDKLLEESALLSLNPDRFSKQYLTSNLGRFVRAYYSYLKIIGIPYLIDLLEELLEKLENSTCKECVDKTRSLITGFNQLLGTLRSREEPL
ncbi:hypothetical protein IMZ38_03705 [Thermosphaera chiliense]|uniref:Uncharacterized protein n=1 Tax=Thermosphaera chiliense TaxID=3402707 RepID=A0A7M1UUD4_9CREN|nr:hypothetical protein [Thermosphaera aggregans]QOR95012.1 hypothetical protein IMZ38_03705 [Thermosphaera aggregans]